MKNMKITFSIKEVQDMVEEHVKTYGYESIENIHSIEVDISPEGITRGEIGVLIIGTEE